MNSYVANLAVLNIKLHNLHWNVKGLEFMAIHNFTEQLYNDFFIKFDDVAELIKIKGFQPLASMKSYLDAASIEESEAESFSPSDVVDILIGDLKVLNKQAVDIRAVADGEGDFEAVAMFEGHISDIEKNLWFLRSMAA